MNSAPLVSYVFGGWCLGVCTDIFPACLSARPSARLGALQWHNRALFELSCASDVRYALRSLHRRADEDYARSRTSSMFDTFISSDLLAACMLETASSAGRCHKDVGCELLFFDTSASTRQATGIDTTKI